MMTDGFKYLSYKGNEGLIEEYFSSLFFFREKNVVDVLRKYCGLKGYVVNDYLSCCFAEEFPERDSEDYFGEEGVAFDFSVPLVPEDCEIIITYEEFYEVVKEKYEKYVMNNLEKKDEVAELLECLKKNILDRNGGIKSEEEKKNILEIKKILKKRMALNSTDKNNIKECRDEMVSMLSQECGRTMIVLQALNEEEVRYISEVFADIAHNLSDIRYIGCLKRIEAKYPNINLSDSVKKAEHVWLSKTTRQKAKLESE